MKVIEVSGDHHAIGRALGEARRETIATAVRENPQFQALIQWKGSKRHAGLLAAAETDFPDIVEEIRGIAEGSGQSFEDMFLWNCRGDLRDLARSDDEGCTTLMIAAGDGRNAGIGHNEDGAEGFAGRGFIARVSQGDGPDFEAFCYPGMLPGHAFGMNAAGIVQTINNIRPGDLTVGLPRHVVTRQILNCETMDDVKAVLQRPDRASGFHHALASAALGRVYSAEAPASGCEFREVTHISVHANHLIRDEMAAVPQEITPSSDQRQKQAEKLVAGGKVDSGDPFDVLFDRSTTPLPILCRGDHDGSDSYTLASAWFRLSAVRVDVTVCHGPDRTPVYESGFDVA